MRTRLLLVFLLAGLVPSLAAEEVPDASSPRPPFVGVVNADRVSLRGGPGLSFEVLWSFPKGAHVHTTAKKGQWYAVELPAEVPVYVHTRFLRMDAAHPTVQGQRVSVRGGPGTAYTNLGFLNEGQIVELRRVTGQWAQIAPVSATRGWIHESFITFLFEKDEELPHGDHRDVPPDSAQGSPGSGSTSPSQRREAAGLDH